MDRDETLRRAEKLLRQGRLDAAIAEYAKLVDEQPRDWATANLLGDLYVRVGQIEQAVTQYTRIAEHLVSEGFVSRAAALYKKIVKIHPDDDSALQRTAELAAKQGLTADAREQLRALYERRLARGDRAGATRAALAYGGLPPGDAAGRLESARMMAEMGDAAGAASQLRTAGEALLTAGKIAEGLRCWQVALRHEPDDGVTRDRLVSALLDAGDPDGARDVARSAAHWRSVSVGLTRVGRDAEALDALDRALRADPTDVSARVHLAKSAMARHDDARARELLAAVAGSTDPTVQLALAEVEFRSGALDRGRAALRRCLASREDLVGPSIDLGCAIGAGAPEYGFAVIDTVVHHAGASGDADLAIDALERFLAVAPGHAGALEALIAACGGQAFYENQRYRAQVQLADVYLAREAWADAREIAEKLAAARPDEPSHEQRLSRALAGLGVPDSENAARTRVRGLATPEGLADFAAFRAAPTALAEDVSAADVAAAPVPWIDLPAPGASPARIVPPASATAKVDELPSREEAPGVVPDRGAASGQEAVPRERPPTEPDVLEIDISVELDDLMTRSRGASAGAPAAADAKPTEQEHPRGLDGFFEGLREERGRHLEGVSAALAYDQASEHFNRDEVDDAVACLRTAARDPLFRFRAASMLARIARERHRLGEAAEWLERAGEAPAPSIEASHGLLYELGDVLESAGEGARALAVFIELQAAAPGYRNVRERIASLSRRQDDQAAGRKGLS